MEAGGKIMKKSGCEVTPGNNSCISQGWMQNHFYGQEYFGRVWGTHRTCFKVAICIQAN